MSVWEQCKGLKKSWMSPMVITKVWHLGGFTLIDLIRKERLICCWSPGHNWQRSRWVWLLDSAPCHTSIESQLWLWEIFCNQVTRNILEKVWIQLFSFHNRPGRAHTHILKYTHILTFGLEKDNSEIKPIKLRLRIDLLSQTARVEGLVNIYHHHH